VPGARPDGAALRTALAGVLPAHAVPSAVTVVAAFPLTVTGKLDEEALPDPRPAAPVVAEPMTPAERRVHTIWCAVLEVYNEVSYAFPWQAGDIMVINNVLMAHGREPFTGRRRILVAMTG
jgi:hypothetical protein